MDRSRGPRPREDVDERSVDRCAGDAHGEGMEVRALPRSASATFPPHMVVGVDLLSDTYSVVMPRRNARGDYHFVLPGETAVGVFLHPSWSRRTRVFGRSTVRLRYTLPAGYVPLVIASKRWSTTVGVPDLRRTRNGAYDFWLPGDTTFAIFQSWGVADWDDASDLAGHPVRPHARRHR